MTDRFLALVRRLYEREPPPPAFPTDRRVPADNNESPTFGRARAAAQAAAKAAEDGEI